MRFRIIVVKNSEMKPSKYQATSHYGQEQPRIQTYIPRARPFAHSFPEFVEKCMIQCVIMTWFCPIVRTWFRRIGSLLTSGPLAVSLLLSPLSVGLLRSPLSIVHLSRRSVRGRRTPLTSRGRRAHGLITAPPTASRGRRGGALSLRTAPHSRGAAHASLRASLTST